MIRRNYPVLDVAKFVAAFFVMAIHAKLFNEILIFENRFDLAWFIILFSRLAVPFFFAVSSFLLFRKILDRPMNVSSWPVFRRFARRLLKLWFFWFIVGQPMFLYMAFRHGWWALSNWIWSVMFVNGGLFYGWFLPALLYSMAFVVFLRSHLSTSTVLIICLLFGVIAILPAYVIPAWTVCSAFAEKMHFQWSTSWATSFIPIALGLWFAEKENDIGRWGRHRLVWWGLFLVSLLGMLVESVIQKRIIGPFFSSGFYPQGLMFSLYPALFAVFMILFSIDVRESFWTHWLRSLSIVMYFFQGTVLYLCWQGFGFLFGHVPSYVVYLISSFTCLVVGMLLIRLSSISRLSWLRNGL